MAVKLLESTKGEIVAIKMLPKDSSAYALKKLEEVLIESDSQYSPSGWHLIVAYKNGKIKQFSLPDFEWTASFDVPTEEVTTLEIVENSCKMVVGYVGGIFRFFDLSSSALIGKYCTGLGIDIRTIKALPDGEFLYWVDANNTLNLLKIESFSPLVLQNHQVMNTMGEIKDFDLHPLESYNRFFLNLGDVYINVYSRKYTNVMKNLSYNNSVPQFFLQDKFPVDTFFKTEGYKAFEENEHFLCSFSPTDKSIIFIVSQARRTLLVRNFEVHNNIKVIEFAFTPLTYVPSMNGGFAATGGKDGVLRLLELEKNEEVQVSSPFELSQLFTMNLAGNSKMIAVESEEIIRVFEVYQ